VKPAVLFLSSLIVGSLVFGCGNASQAASGSAGPSGSAAPAETAAGRVVEVKVTDKGFEPNVIEAKKGETVSLKLTRTTSSECLKAMAIPSLNITKDLPMNQPVIVNVKADQEGKIVFQCWMAMFKGEIDVKG
jgi:plastocyanin domain-containing protein